MPIARTPVLAPPMPVGKRKCENCAAYYTIPHPQNPLERQSFCSKEPPVSQVVRVEVPRLDPQGKPMMQRLAPDKPAVDQVEGVAFAHRPTQPNLVCFDGWRPLAALPGERSADVALRQTTAALVPVVRSALADAPPEQAEQIGQVVKALEAFAAGEELAANDAEAAQALAEAPAGGHS